MSFLIHHPPSLSEAVAFAHKLGHNARYIAGGTDLVVQINRKRQSPGHLIDITQLAELIGIENGPQECRVGSVTTLKSIERHSVFQQTAFIALAEAARVVGGHQIRNVATIGGNIVNASPAADVVVALLALDAEIELVGPREARRLRLDTFFLAPGKTARRGDELLTQIRIPRSDTLIASAFLKAGRRKAMEISVVCIAARLWLDAEARCRSVRLALGAVGPTCMRAYASEALLEGQSPAPALFLEAGRLAAQQCRPLDDVRASARYRRLLVEALVPRALERCCERVQTDKL
jgi:CO/xanthine dehydrogenase FAD-binding subunit